MSDVKWIKIATDIFDDEKIMLIESLPSSDALIVIWFKLLCLAGKNNNDGVFLLNDRIAYTDEMLATIFRRNTNTVKMALKTFEEFGMIQTVDGVVTIPNWNKHQDFSKIKARNEYMRKYMADKRAEQKALITRQNEVIKDKLNTDINGYVNVNNDINNDINTDINNSTNVNTNVNINNPINNDVNVNNQLEEPLTKCLEPCKANVSGAEGDNKDNKEIDNKDIKEVGEKKKKASAFRPPTVEEVKEYCYQRGNNVDPVRFVNFYASKGWYVGKNKMKDWKAAVITWEQSDKDKPPVSKRVRNFVDFPSSYAGEDFKALEEQLLDN